MLKAQQQQEENQKAPLPGKQNAQPPQLNKFAPAANPINNLLSPKDEKMKVPESNRTPANNLNNLAGKANYHYRNSPDSKQAPEPYKGPKIVDASKEKPAEFKNVYQPAPWQAKNAEEKVSNWAKMENNVYKNDVRGPQAPDLPKDRNRNSPNKEPSSRAREEAVAELKNWNPPQVNRQKNILNLPEPQVKQQIQQKQVNRVDPPKRNAVDREIMGGFGGGGGIIGFAPTPSNRNTKEAPKKKENPIVANKKPSNQPVKKNEVVDKAQAQQKLNEVKKKLEDEKVKREKRAAEEAEKKKVIEDLRHEKEKDRAAVRKQMMEDIKKKRVINSHFSLVINYLGK